MCVCNTHCVLNIINTIPITSNINFKIGENEIVGLLGPNGSGKSTLYSTIIGEHQVDSGKIFLKNIDISEKQIQAIDEIVLG